MSSTHFAKILFWLVVMLIPVFVLAQSTEPTLRETQLLKNALAEFDQQLAQTNNIEIPLLSLSGNHWFEHLRNKIERTDSTLIPVDKNILRNNPDLIRRITLATFNLSYFITLQYACQPQEDLDKKEYIFLFPEDVKMQFRQTLYGRKLLKELGVENTKEEWAEFKNEGEVFEVLYSFEMAIVLWRNHQNSLTAPQRSLRNIRLSKIIEEMSEPAKIHFCNPACGDLTEGTRTIVVNHGFFQLTFVAEGEVLRLELIATRLGD